MADPAPDDNKVKATFRLPKPLLKALRLHAVTVERSQEALVEQAIRALLRQARSAKRP